MIIGPLFLVVFFKSLFNITKYWFNYPFNSSFERLNCPLLQCVLVGFFYSLLKKIMCFYCTKEIPREKHNLLIDANNTTIFHIPPL